VTQTLGSGVTYCYNWRGQWLVVSSQLIGNFQLQLTTDDGQLTGFVYGSY